MLYKNPLEHFLFAKKWCKYRPLKKQIIVILRDIGVAIFVELLLRARKCF